MNPTTQSRSPYWDIVKGIGIIAIVLGHSCYFAVGFVYLFHLALFFFVSGYLYSEKKYGDAPFAFFGNRFAGTMAPIRFLYLLLRAAPQFLCKPGAVSEPGAV